MKPPPDVVRAAVACALFAIAGCAARHAASARASSFDGLPVYPNTSQAGSVDGRLAVYSTTDAFGKVADWYVAHMPRAARSARDNLTSQATWAIFAPRDTKTVHIEVVDGTVRITLADVANVKGEPTAR